MNLFEKTGKMALGSRLRLLTAQVTDDAAQIYDLYNVGLSPKWFPVFFVLADEGEKTVSDIAAAIRHSQPSVTKIIGEMKAAGLVKENLASADKRRNVVALTEAGEQLKEKLAVQCTDVDAAIDTIITEATHNLWEAIAEWEYLLRRVQEQKKLRESRDVQIVEYSEQYGQAFRDLNVEWISKYFEMEEADYKALDHPEEYILDKGGKILVALYHNEPVGVCALIKGNGTDYDFELAKMAVSPAAQGKNIGWLLGRAVIEAAKQMGATKLYLESNTILKPAINLYHKLGFTKVVGKPTPYKRCNIQMEMGV
jgi:DNA-binding MarR family transcriptional regulator/GNAT superfamily N-acetyltransferase